MESKMRFIIFQRKNILCHGQMVPQIKRGQPHRLHVCGACPQGAHNPRKRLKTDRRGALRYGQ